MEEHKNSNILLFASHFHKKLYVDRYFSSGTQLSILSRNEILLIIIIIIMLYAYWYG